MQEDIDYVKIEAEAAKIRCNLNTNKELTIVQRVMLLNVLRYDESILEDGKKERKVWY